MDSNTKTNKQQSKQSFKRMFDQLVQNRDKNQDSNHAIFYTTSFMIVESPALLNLMFNGLTEIKLP